MICHFEGGPSSDPLPSMRINFASHAVAPRNMLVPHAGHVWVSQASSGSSKAAAYLNIWYMFVTSEVSQSLSG